MRDGWQRRRSVGQVDEEPDASYDTLPVPRVIAARGRLLAPMKPTSLRSAVFDTATRHLVLVYRPHWQSLADLNTIAGHIKQVEPSFRTFIVPGTATNSVTRKAASRRPSLIV